MNTYKKSHKENLKLFYLILLLNLGISVNAIPNKQLPKINVVEYGALSDGHFDCTPAIQKSIDMLEVSGGGIVIIPPAPLPYVINNTIFIRSDNIEIIGDGATLKLCNGASDGRQTHVIHILGSENKPVRDIIIRGLTIDANYWEQKDAKVPRAIEINWAHHILIDRIRIIRPWVGLTFGLGTKNSEARDCEVNLWHNDAYSVDGHGHNGITSNIRLLRCRAVGSMNEKNGGLPGNRDKAFEIEDGCHNVEIIEAHVSSADGTAYGIRNHKVYENETTQNIRLLQCSTRDIPTSLNVSNRNLDNTVRDVKVENCNFQSKVIIDDIEGEIRIEGGQYGQINFLSGDTKHLENALIKDIQTSYLQIKFDKAGETGKKNNLLRIERSTVLKSFDYSGSAEHLVLIENHLPDK